MNGMRLMVGDTVQIDRGRDRTGRGAKSAYVLIPGARDWLNQCALHAKLIRTLGARHC